MVLQLNSFTPPLWGRLSGLTINKLDGEREEAARTVRIIAEQRGSWSSSKVYTGTQDASGKQGIKRDTGGGSGGLHYCNHHREEWPSWWCVWSWSGKEWLGGSCDACGMWSGSEWMIWSSSLPSSGENHHVGGCRTQVIRESCCLHSVLTFDGRGNRDLLTVITFSEIILSSDAECVRWKGREICYNGWARRVLSLLRIRSWWYEHRFPFYPIFCQIDIRGWNSRRPNGQRVTSNEGKRAAEERKREREKEEVRTTVTSQCNQ